MRLVLEMSAFSAARKRTHLALNWNTFTAVYTNAFSARVERILVLDMNAVSAGNERS